MKKNLLIFALFISLCSFSQTETPFVIQHCRDTMTDKEYCFSEKKLICLNPEKTMGFYILPMFKNENGAMVNNGLTCKNFNVGNCNEKDSLIFLFEDGTKITVVSWNKFNCEGNSYFDNNDKLLKKLSSQNLTTVRFTNGRSLKSFTYNLDESQKRYFISAYTNYKIVEIDCSK